MYFGLGLVLSVIEAVAHSSRLSAIGEQLHASFAETFFMALLPPIIFESGFSMEKKPFFGNFWSICVFAFLGTLLSTVVIGAIIMAGTGMGMFLHFSPVDALLFGAITVYRTLALNTANAKATQMARCRRSAVQRVLQLQRGGTQVGRPGLVVRTLPMR